MPNWETLADGDDIDANKYLDFREYDTIADRDAASASFGSEAMFHICRVVETGYYYWWQGASWIPFSALGGAGAPPSCSFVTINAEADLSAETLHKNIVGADLHITKGHASEHQSGGGDAIKLDDLSAPDDNADLNASTTKHGLLKKLDNDGAHYMDGQGNWTAPPGGGAHDLGGAQHVADSLADVSAKITDATLIDSADVQFKTGALHSAADHQVGWPLELNVTGLSGVLADEQDAGQIKGVTVDDAAKADGKVLGYVAGSGNIEYVAAPAPGAHAATHQNGGGDEINVAGLSGELADNQPPKTHKDTHKTAGSDAFTVADALDALARVELKLGGVSKGKRRGINITNTPSITWAITDDAGNEEVDIQGTATQAGSYKLGASYTIYKVGGTYYAMDSDGNIDYSNASLETVFEAAVNALLAGSTNGGTVLLKAGTYTVDDVLNITAADMDDFHLRIMGEGKASVLSLANNVDDAMFHVLATGASRTFTIELDHLFLDGNKANNAATSNGVEFIDVFRSRIHDCWIDDFNDNGVLLDSSATDSYYICVDHNFIRNQDAAGILIQDTGANTVDCHWIHHNNIGTSSDPESAVVGTHGIYIAGGDGLVNISDNYINQTGQHGVWGTHGSCWVKGNFFDRCGRHGIFIDGTSSWIVGGNQFMNCSRSANNTYDDIHLENGATENLIYGGHHWGWNGGHNRCQYNYNENGAGNNYPNKIILNNWGGFVTGNTNLDAGSTSEVAHNI